MIPTVALTYDDGPSKWTPALLDVLAEHEARATFFVLGQHIAGHENTIRRIVEDGHGLGLHGWTHIEHLHPEGMLRELRMTRAKLNEVCDVKPNLWRAPWNRHPFTFVGFDYVGVDLDGRDVSRGESAIVQTVLGGLRDGIVVGLHDGIAPNGELQVGDRLGTVNATARILEHCRSVTVGELLGVRVGT
jgi:peptidoglycan/xylan/chitin deacetylase (PgdA/CDA1 family)